jgi:tetratricopeptide (TPR) repeat protein
LAFETNADTSAQVVRDKCYDEKNDYSPHERLAACNALIADSDNSSDEIASLIGARGAAHQLLGDNRRAMQDYNAAIRRRPNDAYVYFNRGLILLDTGRLDGAVVDFTRAHEIEPKDPWALAHRGLAHAWKKDEAHATKDFQAVRSIDPSNPVMLRGEAILRINAADTRGAVDRLTASMVRDPNNLWALRTRAELYWELGDKEMSAEDDKRWQQLMEKARTRTR